MKEVPFVKVGIMNAYLEFYADALRDADREIERLKKQNEELKQELIKILRNSYENEEDPAVTLLEIEDVIKKFKRKGDKK